MNGIQDFLMFIPAGYEWLLVIVIIIILFFGVKKIPELARSFAKASSEFEKARLVAKKELQELKLKSQDTPLDREKLEQIADTLGIDYSNKSDDELKHAIESKLDNRKNKI